MTMVVLITNSIKLAFSIPFSNGLIFEHYVSMFSYFGIFMYYFLNMYIMNISIVSVN